MAPDRVLHDLAERVHVGVVVLRVQPDRRVRRAHQRPRHLRVEPALDPRVELVGVEGEEVRALAPGHVDDLDVLALADLVGERGGLVDAEVEPRLGERRRQLHLLARPRHRALQLDHERRRRPVAVDHAPAGRGDDHVGLGAGGELLARAGRPAGPEEPDRAGVLGGEPAVGQDRRRRVGRRPEREPVVAQHGQLGELAAVGVDDRQPVVGPDVDAGRPARPDPPRLERQVDGLEAGREQHGQRAVAGSLAASFSACASSCSASSLLAGGVELLDLVLDHAAVVALVPVVERVEAEQHGLADELAQDLVGRAHHPAGLGVADVALELHVALVAGAAAGVQHLVDVVGDVLRRLELDLPGPVQEVRARRLAGLERAGVVVGDLVEGLGDGEDEQPAGVRVHHGLADVVLDRRVVGHAHADVHVALARRVAGGDVDRAERDPVPDRRGADQEPRVDRLVVRGRAVALGADDLLAGDLDVLDLDRAGLVAAQAERVPQRRLGLDVVAVDDEDGEVVVAGEVGARGLDDVEVGEAAGGGPGRLLVDLVAAVRLLGLGRERVPEVRAGLGVRVGEGPELAAVERPDVLLDQLGRRAQHQRLHRRHVHDVTHRGGRAPVPGDRLAHHRERHVVLAQPAVLLGHREREEPVLAHQLQVAPRVEQLVVGALRVRAHLLLTQADEGLAQLLLAVREDPVGVPVIAQTPEGLGAPHLLRHRRHLSVVDELVQTRAPRSTAARLACPHMVD